uniref:polynucleotide adenylyltransferase n=1 Tax=Ganoderma boninense TaxID=34458 RepID=A0A5K1K3A9_9APHY|nr:2-oxoisovalerate dehydrogenase subunit alpha (EC (Branched-chain alpha-keto acid dehydrogenase E1 component alpha chain) [Ganoderma boninense]
MSSKAHSQRSSVSAPDEQTTSNRRARRKEKQRQNAEAGPSGAQPASSSKPPSAAAEGPKLATRNAANGDRGNSFGNDDFIAFSLSDSEEADRQSARASSPPVREWDRGKPKGKGKDREEHAGRKRKVEEVDFNDGYANKKQRVAAASRRAPWTQDVDWDRCANVAEMLHEEVEAFVKYMSPTPVEDEVRSLSVMLIANAIRKTYSDAEVLPFGSYDTKLDIDLVVYSRSMMRMAKSSVLHSLANIVKRAGITDRVTIIAKAKVPIIKFVTTHGRFSVDISVNQGNGVDAGKMVKQFLRDLPALRSLVLIIKSFLSQRSMNEVFTGGLGSYSIVCLAISFLQMHPKVRRGEIDPSKNLGVLVMEFFELYGSYFNYQEVGISLRNGGSYFNKREKGWFDYRESRLLSIEDPGDPANDISRGSYNFARVRTTLAGAFGIMTAAAYAQASIVAARRTGRAVHLRPTTDPEEMSILASVMGVTQEEVYDRQILHRVLGLVPQPPLSVQDTTSGRASRTAEAESVEDAHAWEEADMDTSDHSEAEAVAESRYDIESRKQPPRKRRRTGTRADEDITHTVYTTDEEEDGYVASHQPLDAADGITEEEEEYAVSAVDGADQERGGGKADKRSYWLSKGLPGGGTDSDD